MNFQVFRCAFACDPSFQGPYFKKTFFRQKFFSSKIFFVKIIISILKSRKSYESYEFRKDYFHFDEQIILRKKFFDRKNVFPLFSTQLYSTSLLVKRNRATGSRDLHPYRRFKIGNFKIPKLVSMFFRYLVENFFWSF